MTGSVEVFVEQSGDVIVDVSPVGSKGDIGIGIKSIVFNEVTGRWTVTLTNDVEYETASVTEALETYESNAAASASAAATQAGVATTQAGISTTRAGEAAGSASTATTQAGIATGAAGTATTQAGIATTQAGVATTKATEADGSAQLSRDWAEKTSEPAGPDTMSSRTAAEIGIYSALSAQEWAEGTEPGGTGTKSAQEHAADAGNQATAAATSAAQAALYDGPKFNTIALMAANNTLTDGKQIVVWDGYNGEPETYIYDAASELTADGALVVDATGMGAGRLVSKRTTFATVADMLADRRTFAVGTKLTAAGFSYEVVSSGEHPTTAGGVKLRVLPGERGYNVKAFGATGDGVTDDTDAVELAIRAAYDSGRVDGDTRYGCVVYIPTGRYRIAQSAALFKSFPRVVSGAASFSIRGDGLNGGYGSTEGASILAFDPPTSGADQVMIDNDSRITFTRFSDIGFVSENGGLFWNGPEGQGVQSFEFRDCGWSGFLDMFDVAGTTNNSEWSFFGCKFSRFDGTAFNFDNEQALSWRFYGCDAEVFTGTLFEWNRGTNVAWWGGSIIPTAATGRIAKIPAGAVSGSFGQNNSPHLKLESVRLEPRSGSLLFEKLNHVAAFQAIFRDSDLGGYHVPAGTQSLKWNGAGRLTFDTCVNLGGHSWDHEADGTSILHYLCVDVDKCSAPPGFIKDSTFDLTAGGSNGHSRPLFRITRTHPELDGEYRPGSQGANGVVQQRRGFAFTVDDGKIFVNTMPGGGWPRVETLELPPVYVSKIEFSPTPTGSYGSAAITVDVKDSGGATLGSATWTMNATTAPIVLDVKKQITQADNYLTFEFSSSYTGAGALIVPGNLFLIY
ncbi:glycosyl hydrolase family 28-related protein [Sulfitobacter sp. M23508]|uniref:glycosyl hydrolase family 28-related protein n=1 Tax=Sulfitobacter sp. M23508 TaxID=3368577 RepID=UPI00374504D2